MKAKRMMFFLLFKVPFFSPPWRPMAFLAVLLFFFVSFCFAEMTIYFRDGKEKRVQKVVFKGDKAELYATDGSVITVPISALDLDMSGIGSPVGTYGETKVANPGKQKVGAAKMPVPGSAARQEALQSEWEHAPITAKARKNVGSIQAGDTVHANTVGSQAAKRDTRYVYYWYDDDTGTLWYDEALNTPIVPDSAYIIVYKNPNGTFGKKILDAATFDSSFDIPKKKPELAPEANSPVSTEPILIPPTQRPQDSKQSPPPVLENKQPEEQATGEAPVAEETSTQGETHTAPEAEGGSNTLILVVVAVIGAGVLVLVYILFQKRSKPFVDSSNFRQYEQDLRDFELEIWLRHGKTLDQLVEICVKKFYQDNQAALNILTRMLKGAQKNIVVPMIMKNAGVQAAAAETIYLGFAERIEIVRKLIDEVSAKKGVAPLKPAPAAEAPKAETTIKSLPPSAVSGTPRTIPPVAPKPAPPVAAKPAPPVARPPVAPAKPAQATASVPQHPPRPPLEISVPMPDPQQKRTGKKKSGPAADLPAYAAGVFNQLGFLTSEEK